MPQRMGFHAHTREETWRTISLKKEGRVGGWANERGKDTSSTPFIKGGSLCFEGLSPSKWAERKELIPSSKKKKEKGGSPEKESAEIGKRKGPPCSHIVFLRGQQAD